MNLGKIRTEGENHFLSSYDEQNDITHLDNNDENGKNNMDMLKIEEVVNLNGPIFDTSENVIINERTLKN